MIQKLFTRGLSTNLTITFADYFYSKYYCGRSAASADAKRPRYMPPDITTAARAPPGSAPSTSAKRNGNLKGPARFRSLDFGERNGYLKGIAPIDAQQESMEL